MRSIGALLLATGIAATLTQSQLALACGEATPIPSASTSGGAGNTGTAGSNGTGTASGGSAVTDGLSNDMRQPSHTSAGCRVGHARSSDRGGMVARGLLKLMRGRRARRAS